MVVKNLLSKIRENLEVYRLEDKVRKTYAKYGPRLLESLEGYLKSLRESTGKNNEYYIKVLKSLLKEEVIEYIDYINKKESSIFVLPIMNIIFGISEFVRYVGDHNQSMFGDYMKVLWKYTDIRDPQYGDTASEIISTKLFYYPYYGTPLKENDYRISTAVKCTLDELLKEETKQKVEKDTHTIEKIIKDCAKKAGFRPFRF